jgi:hypothetical protein
MLPSYDEQLREVRSDKAPCLNSSQHSQNQIDSTDDLQHRIALLTITPILRPQPQGSTQLPQHRSHSSQERTSHQAATTMMKDCTDRHSDTYRRDRLPSTLHSSPKYMIWPSRSPSSKRQQVDKPRLACLFCRIHKTPCSTPLPGSKSCM